MSAFLFRTDTEKWMCWVHCGRSYESDCAQGTIGAEPYLERVVAIWKETLAMHQQFKVILDVHNELLEESLLASLKLLQLMVY